MNERSDTFRRCVGVVAAAVACTQGSARKNGKAQRGSAMNTGSRDGGTGWAPWVGGGGERSLDRGSRVNRWREGTRSRQTQYVVKDTESGKPINSNKCQKLQKALHAKA